MAADRPGVASTVSGMSDVTVDEAAALLESGALLLDVREQEEWDAGHVDGALLMPMNSVVTRLEELPADRTIVVICRSGGRSGVVTKALSVKGFAAVNVAGGLLAWAAGKHPVVTDDGIPGSVS